MALNMSLRAPVQSRNNAVAVSSRSVQVAALRSETMKVTTALTAASAAVMASAPAFAANEVSQVADGGLNFLLLLLLPALGWVGINILGPLNNQLKEMEEKRKNLAIVGGLFMAGLASSGPAQAAQEVAQTATGGGKFASVALFFVVAGIWIAMYLAAENNPRAQEDK